jgi:hypothetical protein
VLAVYFHEQNILIIERSHFDKLTPAEQERVLRTHEPVLFTTDYAIAA